MQPMVLFIDWNVTLSNSRFGYVGRQILNILKTINLFKKFYLIDTHDLLTLWIKDFKTIVSVIGYVAEHTGLAYEKLTTEL